MNTIQRIACGAALAASLTTANAQQTPARAAASCKDCGVVQAIVPHGQTQQNQPDAAQAVIWTSSGYVRPYWVFYVDLAAQQRPKYDVLVKMDDGKLASFTYAVYPGWVVGERVKMDNGTIAGR
jgi:hypothetical protein